MPRRKPGREPGPATVPACERALAKSYFRRPALARRTVAGGRDLVARRRSRIRDDGNRGDSAYAVVDSTAAAHRCIQKGPSLVKSRLAGVLAWACQEIQDQEKSADSEQDSKLTCPPVMVMNFGASCWKVVRSSGLGRPWRRRPDFQS